MTLYKSFKADFKNEYGNIQWKLNEWVHQDGVIIACENGLHASKRVIDAIKYVPCEILAEVEVKGKSDLTENDKECWSDMRIIKAYKWEKEDSVKLAIFAAELAISNYEKEYPNDDRPRKAIESAKNWLKNPTLENQNAARSAESAGAAARYAESAWSAARSAESAAESAARYAESAWSAARSARYAAESAESADKILNQCEDYIQKEIIPNLKEIK